MDAFPTLDEHESGISSAVQYGVFTSEPEWDFDCDESAAANMHGEQPEAQPTSLPIPPRLARLFDLELDDETVSSDSSYSYFGIFMLPLPSPSLRRRWWQRWLSQLQGVLHSTVTANLTTAVDHDEQDGVCYWRVRWPDYRF